MFKYRYSSGISKNTFLSIPEVVYLIACMISTKFSIKNIGQSS